MWLILILFSAFWIADWRLKRYSWSHTLGTLAFMLVLLVPMALYGPGWGWKTALMIYLTVPYWAVLLSVRQPIAPAEPRVRLFDPDRDDVWPELPRMVDAAAAGLEAEGLRRIAVFTEELATGVATLTAACESPDQTEVVSITGATHLTQPGTEFERRFTQVHAVAGMVFEDGRRLAVANTALVPAAEPGTTWEILPSVDDPAQLLRIARAYRARRFAGVRPVPVRGGVPPLEYMTNRQRRQIEWQAASSLYRAGRDGAIYVTLLGAMVVGWGLLFPFRQMGDLRRRLRERRILRELGMDAGTARVPRPRTRHPFDLHLATAWIVAILLIILH